MTGMWGEGTYRFSAGEDVQAGVRYDFIIISSKSKDTGAVCRQFANVIRGTETISLQNGIGNEEIIAKFTDRVIGGMIITGFEWRGDAAVHVSVEAGPMKLGRFPVGIDGPVHTIVCLVREAGMKVEGSTAIRSDLWSRHSTTAPSTRSVQLWAFRTEDSSIRQRGGSSGVSFGKPLRSLRQRGFPCRGRLRKNTSCT